MQPEWTIARRHLTSPLSPFSVKLLKWIGLIGVAIGVFSLVVVLSVMHGFEKKFEEKILGFQAHLTLTAPAEAETQLPLLTDLTKKTGVVTAESWLEGELVIQSSFGTAAGAKVRGLQEPVETMRAVEQLHLPTPRQGRLHAEGKELPGIILGTELAASLEVHPDFKDEVKLVFPFGDVSPTGEILPRVRRFLVTGLFESGFYEYDHKYAFIDYAMA